MKLFLCNLFLIAMPLNSLAYDCSKVGTFKPFEFERVSIVVDHFFWTIENGKKIQKTERVCETTSDIEIGVYDIRGREQEWYYCFYQKERPHLECHTTYKEKPAFLIVRPAAVIRSYSRAPARDTHAHIFLAPEQNWDQYHDTFMRSMSVDLTNRMSSLILLLEAKAQILAKTAME